jgi:hypothetical protein
MNMESSSASPNIVIIAAIVPELKQLRSATGEQLNGWTHAQCTGAATHYRNTSM